MITYLNGSFYPKGCHRVGTDALVCPPEHNQRKPPQAPPEEGMSPNGMSRGGRKGGQTRASVPTVKPHPRPYPNGEGE